MTLAPGRIVSGSVTLAVTPVSSTVLLSSDGLAITAHPGTAATPSSSGGGLSGFAALINALESLANDTSSIVSTLDDISSQGAEWASGGLSDSSFGPSFSSSVDLALSQLTQLIPRIEVIPEEYEMQDLTQDGLDTVINARDGGVRGFDILQSLRKLTNNISNLREGVRTVLEAYLLQITGVAGILTAVEAALLEFADYPRTLKQQPIPSNSTANSTAVSTQKTTTSASSTSTASATPSPYIIGTKEGTPLSTFQNFIKTLPDGGQGDIIAYPNVRWQTYISSLTAAQAQEISSLSFVLAALDLAAVGFGEADGALPDLSKKLRKRDPPDFWERVDSDDHLRIISAGKQDTIDAAGGSLPDYFFDASLGRGATIYIIDSGYRLTHRVCQSSWD